jgi:hypothetical protein
MKQAGVALEAARNDEVDGRRERGMMGQQRVEPFGPFDVRFDTKWCRRRERAHVSQS